MLIVVVCPFNLVAVRFALVKFKSALWFYLIHKKIREKIAINLISRLARSIGRVELKRLRTNTLYDEVNRRIHINKVRGGKYEEKNILSEDISCLGENFSRQVSTCFSHRKIRVQILFHIGFLSQEIVCVDLSLSLDIFGHF